MKKICVITGASSGFGAATAKLISKDYYVIMAARSKSKLEGVLAEIKQWGRDAEFMVGDVTDKAFIRELAQYAASKGEIGAVVHCAGIGSGAKNAGPADIIRTNALSTVYVNMEFGKVMQGGCILDVASDSADLFLEMRPEPPYDIYKSCFGDGEKFVQDMLNVYDSCNFSPEIEQIMDDMFKVKNYNVRLFAYRISKNFARWFAEQSSCMFMDKKIRVISLSPGSFDTALTRDGYDADAAQSWGTQSYLGRMGNMDEFAATARFLLSEDAAYINCTDLLMNAGMNKKTELSAEDY